ncbi:MAG: hypothetical protein MN733_37470 [Nitrososphaera sp.]|nr:hypothetical protein [Nitrososphaera sp.]
MASVGLGRRIYPSREILNATIDRFSAKIVLDMGQQTDSGIRQSRRVSCLTGTAAGRNKPDETFSKEI